jgi:hypothetical protein
VADLISRVTIFSLLLALMLGVGIRLRTQGQRDGCAAYLAGDKTAPATVYVVTGTRTVIVSCDEWLPRQTERVQLLCVLELLLVGVFVVHAWGDARDWFGAWRRRRGMR